MTDSRIILNFCIIFIPMTAVTMLNPTYALYLEKTLKIKPSNSGYILAISTGTYALFCPVVGFLM